MTIVRHPLTKTHIEIDNYFPTDLISFVSTERIHRIRTKTCCNFFTSGELG